MVENKLKLHLNEGIVKLPDWVVFSLSIGRYLKEHTRSQGKPTRMLISLPNNDYIPLLIAIGIADGNFELNEDRESVKEKILSLQEGHRIIYLKDGKPTNVSVIEVGTSPVTENEMMLHVLIEGMKLGIPERQWSDRIILTNGDEGTVKRSRKVSDKKILGIKGNGLLKKIYPLENLLNSSSYSEDAFYMIGNLKKIHNQMNEHFFYTDDVYGSPKDFLYTDDENSFTNGKVISSQKRDIDFKVMESVPVIYWGCDSYLRQRHHFKSNPSITIFSRTENESRIDELLNEVEREMVHGGHEYMTDHMRRYLNEKRVDLPRGIELMVWR